MNEKSFESATEADGQRRAADWIKSQPGIRVVDIVTSPALMPITRVNQPIRSRWTIIVKYEDGSN